MYLNSNLIIQIRKLSVLRSLMIWWRPIHVEKVILPLRDGLTIIRKKVIIYMETTRQNKIRSAHSERAE